MQEVENYKKMFYAGRLHNVVDVKFSELLGKTFTKIVQDETAALYFVTDKAIYKMYHSQDCCESVHIEDICGDLNDLVDSEILVAEETIEKKCNDIYESATFTFYHLRTMKGTVTIRWHGESNGYYSESVDLCKLDV